MRAWKRFPDLANLARAQKDTVIHELWDWVTALRQEVVELKVEVTNLRGKLAKNSRNSSIPSSAEGLKKTRLMRKNGTHPPVTGAASVLWRRRRCQ